MFGEVYKVYEAPHYAVFSNPSPLPPSWLRNVWGSCTRVSTVN